jgi:hypothetical protein
MGKPSFRDKLLRAMLISSVLACMLTVAVAWLISIRTWRSNDRPVRMEFVDTAQRFSGNIAKLPGSEFCTVQVYGRRVWEVLQKSRFRSEASPPGWAVVPNPPEDYAVDFSTTFAAGWPRMALVCVYADNHSYGRGSLHFSVRGQEYMLPARPYWPGLLSNAGLYAGAIFAVFMIFHVGRRWFRHRRGRCLRCGYSLADLPSNVCPECGAGSVPSSTHAPRLPPPKPLR